MASLAGKADATLVQAAYAAGMAGVPKDYSEQFGIMSDAHKTLLEGVETAWKAYETTKKADTKELEGLVKSYTDYGMGIENDFEYDEYMGKIDAQVAEWEAAGGWKNDPKARRNWERENLKIMNLYKSSQTDAITNLEKWTSNNAWKEGMTNGKMIDGEYSNEIGYLTNYVKYGKNLDGKSGQYNAKATEYMKNNTGEKTMRAGKLKHWENPEELWKHLGAKDGEMVKYFDPHSGEFNYITQVTDKITGVKHVINKKSSDIEAMIPDKDREGEEGVWKFINNITTSANQTTAFYGTTQSGTWKNKLDKYIDERTDADEHGNAFAYISAQTYGPMEISFPDWIASGAADKVNTLLGTMSKEKAESIISSLGGIKSDGDGILERSDFTAGKEGQANFDAVAQSIIKGKASYDLSKKLFVNYVDKFAFKPLWNAARKRDGDDDQTGFGGVGQRPYNPKGRANIGVSGSTKDPVKHSFVNQIYDTLKGGEIKLNNGTIVKRFADGSWKSDDEKTTLTGDQVMLNYAHQLEAQSGGEGTYYYKTAEDWNKWLSIQPSFKEFYSSGESDPDPVVASAEQISHMARAIWSPNTPKGYGTGENAKALKDYLDENFSTQMSAFYAEHGDQSIFVSGEHIRIKKNDQEKEWTADSIGRPFKGGQKMDLEDINEILEFLGLKLP